MKDTHYVTRLIIAIIELNGCSKWVKLDNSPANSVDVHKAEKKCKYWEILKGLSNKDITQNAFLNIIEDEDEKIARRNRYEKEKQLTLAKLNLCMQNEGFKKQDNIDFF
jgi:hypothetical protein